MKSITGFKKAGFGFIIFASLVFGFCCKGYCAETKIAYVDLGSIFDDYNKTKDFDAKLEDKHKGKQTSIDAEVKSIKEMQDQLSLLADKEKTKKQEEIDKKAKTLQEFQQKSEVELKEERDEKLKEILKDIQDIVEAIAKEKGYDLIVNSRVLLYGNNNLDISKEILKRLNDQYKKK